MTAGTPGINPPAPIQRNILADVFFLFSLFAALASGPHLWIARVAWALLPIFFAMDFRYAVCSVFFYATFFMPSGFIPDLFFTVKHFHIALALAAAVQLVQKSFFTSLREGIRRSKPMLYLVPIILISVLPLFHAPASWTTLKLTANFVSVLLMIVYLTGMVTRTDYFREGILFFLFGLSVQVLAGLTHDLLWFNAVSGQLIHNNHMGILIAFSIFYAIPLAMPPSSTIQRAIAVACLAILATGLAFSCTRTAWLSFLAGFLIFFLLVQRHPQMQKFRRRVLRLGLLFALVLGIAAAKELAIFARMKEVLMLFSMDAWNHTFSDSQNFGFFGSFRLMQIFNLNEILKTNALFGIGFQHEIVGYHGFLFTLLGATGLTGLALYMLFIRSLLYSLRKSMNRMTCPGAILSHISVYCALSVWFLCSFMETLFLQYAVWINVFSVFYLTSACQQKENC